MHFYNDPYRTISRGSTILTTHPSFQSIHVPATYVSLPHISNLTCCPIHLSNPHPSPVLSRRPQALLPFSHFLKLCCSSPRVYTPQQSVRPYSFYSTFLLIFKLFPMPQTLSLLTTCPYSVSIHRSIVPLLLISPQPSILSPFPLHIKPIQSHLPNLLLYRIP